jgi:hypothetical protein
MTFFLPRKSDSFTATRLLVLLALTLKSGATSPTFSGVFGIVTFWAKAAVVAAAAKATMERCFIFAFARRCNFRPAALAYGGSIPETELGIA